MSKKVSFLKTLCIFMVIGLIANQIPQVRDTRMNVTFFGWCVLVSAFVGFQALLQALRVRLTCRYNLGASFLVLTSIELLSCAGSLSVFFAVASIAPGQISYSSAFGVCMITALIFVGITVDKYIERRSAQ